MINPTQVTPWVTHLPAQRQRQLMAAIFVVAMAQVRRSPKSHAISWLSSLFGTTRRMLEYGCHEQRVRDTVTD